MEKKTLGTFLAALRKANGMTQKQLADLLNVSDKAISRWERDECAPDLSLIPVLAEIFGITADELLRGERRSPEASPQQEERKTEKQLRRILSDAAAKLRIRSILSLCAAMIGLIAAMICNLGFLRAYIGFMVGSIFYLVAAVMESVFLIQSHNAVSATDFDGAAMHDYRKTMVSTGIGTYSAIVVLFAATLPLMIYPWDTYMGMDLDAWLPYGLAFGLVGGLLCLLASWLVKMYLTKSNFLTPSPADAKRNSLRKKTLLAALIILLTTAVAMSAFYNFTSAITFTDGISFDNWADFKTFMETPTDYDGYGYTTMEYITEDGSSFKPDEFPVEEIRAEDGTLLCEYQQRNMSVSRIHYGDPATQLLPVTVYTYEHIRQGYRIRDNINTGFILLLIAAYIITAVVYCIKSKKL